MYKIDHPSAVQAPPPPSAPTNPGYFSQGDIYSNRAPTTITTDWLNAVQGEIANVITSAGLSLSKGNNAQMAAAITILARLAQSDRAGEMFYWAATTPPLGRALLCDGKPVLRVGDTAALFAVIGTTYGSGDGATTFNVPDARGVFVRVLDNAKGIDTGRAIGTVQASTIQSHTHAASAANGGDHAHTASAGEAGNHDHSGVTVAAGSHAHGGASNNAGTHDHGAATGNNGAHTHALLGHWTGGGGTGGQDLNHEVSPLDVATQPAGAHEHVIYPEGDHSHGINAEPDHAHGINQGGTHSHGISVANGGTHAHDISVAASGGVETRPINIAMPLYIRY